MADKIDSTRLEKALEGDAKTEQAPQQGQLPQMPKDVEIGFHNGALNTLVAERNELIQMVANVEAIMQAHLTRLEELGVKIQKQVKKK